MSPAEETAKRSPDLGPPKRQKSWWKYHEMYVRTYVCVCVCICICICIDMYRYVYVYIYICMYMCVYIPVGFDWVFWWVELMSRGCGFESGFITGKDRICWPFFDRKSRATLEIKLENHVITSISMRVHTISIYICTIWLENVWCSHTQVSIS